MAPTITVDADPTQVDGSTTQATSVTSTDAPLAALGQPIELPAPNWLGQELFDQLSAGVLAARERRGPVTQPEDTHDLIRATQSARNKLEQLISVLRAVLGLIDEVQLEELATAVGADRLGVPKGNMSVPYEGETIKLTREFESNFATDVDQLLVAVRSLVATNWREDGEDPAADPEQFAREVSLVLLEDIMSQTKPKVRGVEALAVTLGSKGENDAAAIARGSHRKVGSTFKRVKIEQVTPSQEAARPPVIGRRK